jgi:hypothetical protein
VLLTTQEVSNGAAERRISASLVAVKGIHNYCMHDLRFAEAAQDASTVLSQASSNPTALKTRAKALQAQVGAWQSVS